MNVSVILAHPHPRSFNHALARLAVKSLRKNLHRVFFHDLYKEKFNPVLPAREIKKDSPLSIHLERACKEIKNADGFVIIHPNWWGQPPAILKGWIDRVLRPGIAYEFEGSDQGEGIPAGLLKASRAVVFNTSNTPALRERKVFGDPLETLWKTCIFSFCGVRKFYRRTYGVMATSTPGERSRWLCDTRKILDQVFPAPSWSPRGCQR